MLLICALKGTAVIFLSICSGSILHLHFAQLAYLLTSKCAGAICVSILCKGLLTNVRSTVHVRYSSQQQEAAAAS